jgi:predicted Fe-Mo cluster-binding NifX family protein
MIAIPVMKGRVAPVLNWCSRILVFPATPGEGASQELWLPELTPLERLHLLQDKRVDTLICGALSIDLQNRADQLGLKIYSGVAGEVDKVLQAFRENRLHRQEFWLPGCQGPRCYGQGWRQNGFLVNAEHEGGKVGMPVNRSGRGAAKGRGNCPGGSGGAGGARGKGNNLGGVGTGGFCRCPACGTQTPHERGIPCIQLNCPQCGKPMVRG